MQIYKYFDSDDKIRSWKLEDKENVKSTLYDIPSTFNSEYDSLDIKFEKIASIKPLPPQHVYDLSIEGTKNFIANGIIAHNTARYFRYLAKFNTSNSNLTPILHDVTINYTGIFTDSFGSYNYTLTAPTTAATYTIKVNSTWDNIISGESLQSLTVRDLTCTCPASGDWGINVADNCVITSDCNMQGNNVYGSGTLTINALIYNFNRFASHGSTIVCVRQAGCFG